ncbi:hypothetical protein [Paenibacillus sp. JCM 10914]|uniref:hypothetical protein n=1 Tax=Paenibacillus sp. JCM 10914 TaxID=1236974 RepID=UPI0003CC4A6C|nr:hypothetical protein [Paenibacillus sp. JCM 10914]GAE08144.1 hypothetical protein JCM10914_4410 [Paenibacillus sp. JCM 10914]
MKPLTTDIHLHTAMLNRTPIVVFIADKLIGSGKIEGITVNSVKVAETRYLRDTCTFKYGGLRRRKYVIFL